MVTLKIISGGQTGADQGALVGAKEAGFETGGTAPAGYKTENGYERALLMSYGLDEHQSPYYKERTYKNVKDAYLTVWIGKQDSPGFACTMNAVRECHRVAFKFSKNWTEEDVDLVAAFIGGYGDMHTVVVNFAGNRESTNPGIHESTKNFVLALKRNLNGKE